MVNIYPISWKAVTDPLPITTTVKELKLSFKYINNIDSNQYMNIHHKNIPVADNEQLMGMESLSAKPRSLNLHFLLNGSVGLLKQTILFNDTLENTASFIAQKYFISPDQVQFSLNKNQLDTKKSISQNKIINEDKITIKLKEVSYKFKINGNDFLHYFLPNQTISEVLEAFLNENANENKGDYLIPNTKDFEMISEIARKYSPNPIEVIWRDPNKKAKYAFIYIEENDGCEKENRIERAFDLNVDTTIQEVRSLIARKFLKIMCQRIT